MGDVDTFPTLLYVMVDDCCTASLPSEPQPGPQAALTRSEVFTLQPVCHRDNRCGPAGPGRMVILIPSWLPFIMPLKHYAAQRTFCLQLLLLQIVCRHWFLPFDPDSVNMHGLEPVKTRINGDDPTPYPAAPLHCA